HYMKTEKWLFLGKEELAVEREQLGDEGKDLTAVADEFEALTQLDLDNDLSLQPRVNALFERARTLSSRADYPYDEPSDLAAIRAARPEGPRTIELKLDD